MEKRCNKCGTVKPVSEFNKAKSKKDGYQSYCRKCNSDNLKEHYTSNKEHYSKKKKNRRRKIKEFISKVKKNGKCTYCPENHEACLDFHHNDPKLKEHQVVKMVNNRFGKKRIAEEVAKCTILCSNCHRKLHYYEHPHGE